MWMFEVFDNWLSEKPRVIRYSSSLDNVHRMARKYKLTLTKLDYRRHVWFRLTSEDGFPKFFTFPSLDEPLSWKKSVWQYLK